MARILKAFAGFILLVGLIAQWVTSQRLDRRLQDELGRLTRQIEELRDASRALDYSPVSSSHHARNPDTPTAGAVLPMATAVAPVQAAGAAEPSPKKAAPEWQDLLDRAEAEFIGEAYDRGWSSETASQLRSKLSHLAHDARLRAIECRESLCRLETSHPDAKQYEAFQSRTFSAREFGWDGPMLFAPLKEEPSGELVAVTYLTRPGRTSAYLGEVD